MIRKTFSRVATGVLAAAMAVSVGAAPAFADDEVTYSQASSGAYYNSETVSTSELPTGAVSTTGAVKAAATRAAMPAVEILGLSSVEESGQFITMYNGRPVYDWNQPKYMLFASNHSDNISPYLANFASGNSGAAVYNASRALGNGPNASLDPDDSTDAAVLAMNPTVIIGTGGGTTGYTGTGVAYSFSDYDGLKTTMTNIANAASGTNTNTAYQQVASKYNNYISNTFTRTANTASSRFVVLITNYSNGEYIFGDTGTDGTASTNRYLETAAKAGAYNLGELYSSMDATTLKAINPLILVGGQQSSSNYSTIMNQLYSDKLLNKAYFVKDNSNYGAAYGVVMNSVENAQNVGRILEGLYLDLTAANRPVSQQSWLAYYYEKFYHIKNADLADVMNKSLDGVRNWNITVTDADYATYNTLDLMVDHLTSWSASDGGYDAYYSKSTLEGYFE